MPSQSARSFPLWPTFATDTHEVPCRPGRSLGPGGSRRSLRPDHVEGRGMLVLTTFRLLLLETVDEPDLAVLVVDAGVEDTILVLRVGSAQ